MFHGLVEEYRLTVVWKWKLTKVDLPKLVSYSCLAKVHMTPKIGILVT